LFPRKLSDLSLNGSQKVGWGPGMADPAISSCFQALAIRSDGPVRFSFGVLAGGPGTGGTPNLPGGFNNQPPVIPATIADPWYIAAAVADRDNDGINSRLSTMSLSSDVYVDEDTE
jgi:hypothetical protein